MKIIRENINFERGKDPKESLNLGGLEYFKMQGVRLFFNWGQYPKENRFEGEEARKKAIKNIKKIREYFDLLKKNGVDPHDMEISDHDSISIDSYEVIEGNRVIFNCLNQKQAEELIEECKKKAIYNHGTDFRIERRDMYIYFTEYMKNWLENL